MAAGVSLNEAQEQILSVWQSMAPGWEARRSYLAEFSNEVTTWLIAKLDPKPGQTILEIAAGPGDTGYAVARRIGDRGKLISTDLAPAMVEVARRRAAEVGATNVEFRVLDAQKNDLATDSVDGVLCRWGYSLMLEPGTALAQTRRVLRPGGTHTLTVMGTPAENPWGSQLMRAIVGLGLIPPPDPRHPGGLFSLAEHDDLHKLIESAGFDRIEIENMDFRLRFTDFEDYWKFMLEFAGGVSALLQGFPEAARTKVRQATEQNIAPFATKHGYEFPGVTVNAAAS